MVLSGIYIKQVKGDKCPCFFQNFISNKVFRVRLGSVYSDIHGQEMGVPQGSMLSVTLFI